MMITYDIKAKDGKFFVTKWQDGVGGYGYVVPIKDVF